MLSSVLFDRWCPSFDLSRFLSLKADSNFWDFAELDGSRVRALPWQNHSLT